MEFKKKQVIDIDKPFESKIFLVKPKEIYLLFEKYGHSLFYKNIRNPLPNSLFNKAIKSTILDNAVNFWYFNNGITAITNKIEPFHDDSTTATVSGIQVINGAQTVYSIHDAYKYATDEQRAKMDESGLITLRIVTSGGDDFDLKVTRFTNSQNPVQERDFHANDEVQKRLQRDFLKCSDVWYETRRGEFRSKPRDVLLLSNETLGQTYLAYFINDPFLAKQSKKLIFVSRHIDPRGLYETIFNDANYDDMLLSYYLNKFVDNERKIIKSKIDAIDTTNSTEEDKKLLLYDFIQYSNFEIMALFKVLFYKVNEDNLKSINGKAISYFENETLDKIKKGYEYITSFILHDLNDRKSIDSKIVNSVLFKNKEYYSSIKSKFEQILIKESEKIKNFKL